jgi:hypothetical protein
MFKPKKLILLLSLLVVGVLLLAACGADEPTPAAVEEVVDTETEANAAADAETMAEESEVASDFDAASESAAEEQIPTLKKEVPRISVEELKERLDSGETIVIGDTRSPAVYDANHIVGAISTPSAEVLSQLEGVPLDQAIVLYCS